MRIVQLVTRRQRRGAETFAAQLSDSLVQRGHEVTLVGIYTPPQDALVPLCARYEDLDHDTPSRLSLRLISDLADRLSKLRPDVVQANGSDTLKYAVFARLRSRAKWRLVYRNISIGSSWLRYPGHRFWVQWLLRQVDHTAAVSERARVDLEEVFRIRPDRVNTIPIGTAVPETLDRAGTRQLLLAEIGAPADAEILLHIGSFSPEKNHAWLLGVFEMVLATRPSAHLILVGDGKLRPSIEQAASARGLANQVHFLGSRPDAGRLTAGADLLVLPSTVEGIPGVILEAGAHGTACVATDVGSVREALIDGVTGFLVKPGDSRAFANTLLELLAEPRRRTDYGNQARARIGEHFALESIVDSFDHLYRKLVPSAAAKTAQRSPTPDTISGSSAHAAG